MNETIEQIEAKMEYALRTNNRKEWNRLSDRKSIIKSVSKAKARRDREDGIRK